MADLTALTKAIEAGNRVAAAELTQAAIDAAIDPREILGALTVAMDVIGRKFQDGEIFVPEMLISARAMKAGTALLEPVLAAAGVMPEFRAIVGTVEGDLHDIGKKWWHDVEGRRHGGHRPRGQRDRGRLRGRGPRAPCAPHRDLGAADHDHAQHARRGRSGPASGLSTKVVIGGAPTTPEFAAQIGADGFAPDAGAAVDLARQDARRLTGRSRKGQFR